MEHRRSFKVMHICQNFSRAGMTMKTVINPVEPNFYHRASFIELKSLEILYMASILPSTLVLESLP